MGLMDAIRRVGAAPRRAAVPQVDVAGEKVLLVYLFPGLGDAVLLAPVVAALLEAGAKAPIGLLLREPAARAWKNLDLPVRIHVLPEALAARPEPDDDEAVAERLRLAVPLEKKGYGIAVDLTARADLDAKLWLARSKAAVRLGYQGEGGPPELTWAAPDERSQGLEHWTRYLSAPLTPCRLGPLPAEIGFKVSEAAETKAASLWGPGPRVLLVPGSRSEAKRFDPTLFASAGRLALGREGSVALLGAPNERKLLAQLKLELGGEGEIYAAKGLGPAFALVRSADVVVTNDTGPMHLAYLSGRRTVAIFTKMSASCWGPMRVDPRFSTLTVPPGTEAAVRPVVERLVLERLAQHLDAL